MPTDIKLSPEAEETRKTLFALPGEFLNAWAAQMKDNAKDVNKNAERHANELGDFFSKAWKAAGNLWMESRTPTSPSTRR